jgi:hypothetical protein
MFISAMTIGEIHRGIVKIQRDQPERATGLRQWMYDVEELGRGKILSVVPLSHAAGLNCAMPTHSVAW